jgi:hypothetical protein
VAEGADADQYSELGYLSCARYEPESRQDNLSRVMGFENNGRSDTYYRIIMDAREEEISGANANHAKANLYTHSRIDPGGFGGESFGLAAALADRSARYNWAPSVAQRRIVATGVILRSRAGEVGPVDSFLEKLNLLERELPAGAIFICPAGNLRTASGAEKALLAQLQSSKGIRIRAIDNLSELEDLFDRPETRSAPASPDRPAAKPPLEPPPARSAPPVEGRRRSVAPLVMIAAVGATAVLATLYLAATFVNADRLAPEQAQKISDLVQAQAGRPASAMSAQQCGELTKAARAVAGIESRRFDAPANAALAEASTCARRLSDSDLRLANLADAERQLASKVLALPPCTSLAVAVDHLDTFDQDRFSDIHKQALANANACRPLLAESDKRLAEFNRRAQAVTPASGDLAACEALIAAGRQLTDSDIARLQAKPESAYDKLATCSDQIQSSDSRIGALVNAADAFAASNAGSVEALAAARGSLQPADFGRLDPARKDRLLGLASQASELVRTSDARIAAFVASYREWQRNPSSSNAAVYGRAGQLSDFDRARLTSSDARDALAALAAVRKEMAGRSERWSAVEHKVAEASRQSPADYWKNLNDAVGRLTQQDRDNATSAQIETLQKANDLLAAAAPRTIPGDEFATMPARRPTRNPLEGYQAPPPAPDDFATVPSSNPYNSGR